MSKIPYRFFPIPEEFFCDQFLEDPQMLKLIRYIFKRIQTVPHIEKIKSNGWHEVHLEPFEFLFGREMCAKETGLTEKQIRSRMDILRASSFVSSSATSFSEKKSSSFTVYRLVTESFNKINGQQISEKKGQQKGQQLGQLQDIDIREQEVVICLKETSKEKSNSDCSVVVSLPLSHNEKEEQEQIDAFYIYLSSLEIQTDKPTIKRWLRFGPEKLRKTISFMQKSKKSIPNPGGWIQKALSENWAEKEEFRSQNREFVMKFKADNKISRLKINKFYCVDLDTGNDYQYNLYPEEFMKILKEKFI